MQQVNCYIPIKLRITGRPSDAQLDELGETLVRALMARIAFAEGTIAFRHETSSWPDVLEPAREAYDPAREGGSADGYYLPSHNDRGQLRVIPWGKRIRRGTIPRHLKAGILTRGRIRLHFENVRWLIELNSEEDWVRCLNIDLAQVLAEVDVTVELFRVRAPSLTADELTFVFQRYLEQRHQTHLRDTPYFLFHLARPEGKAGLEGALQIALDRLFVRARVPLPDRMSEEDRRRHVLLTYASFPAWIELFMRDQSEEEVQPAETPAPAELPFATEEGAYPHEIALFTTYLLRGGYIRQVADLLPVAWRSMSEAGLTAYLSKRYTEKHLRGMFLEKYTARTTIKARFRKANILAALVIGLVWARENIAEGEWEIAAAKVGGSGIAAFALNRLLYARDPSPTAIMRNKGRAFGRWFKGAARTNKFVNFLTRRVGGALLLWEVKDLFMSGGYGGPNIPFDLIVEIDIDDPTTWREPDQVLLDLGFNIWYQQECTENCPEACGPTPIYLGMVEGSAIKGVLKLLGIAPHEVSKIRDRLYRIEGEWDVSDFLLFGIVHRRVSAEENVLAVATGRRSGLMMSGRRGHFRELEVRPANDAAVELFSSPEPQFVPEYLLHPLERRPRPR